MGLVKTFQAGIKRLWCPRPTSLLGPNRPKHPPNHQHSNVLRRSHPRLLTSAASFGIIAQRMNAGRNET